MIKWSRDACCRAGDGQHLRRVALRGYNPRVLRQRYPPDRPRMQSSLIDPWHSNSSSTICSRCAVVGLFALWWRDAAFRCHRGACRPMVLRRFGLVCCCIVLLYCNCSIVLFWCRPPPFCATFTPPIHHPRRVLQCRRSVCDHRHVASWCRQRLAMMVDTAVGGDFAPVHRRWLPRRASRLSLLLAVCHRDAPRWR